MWRVYVEAAIRSGHLWHPPDRRRFMIFAQGRTGGTLLSDLLGSHPSVVRPEEILEWRKRRPRTAVELARWAHPGKVFGYHVKIYQLSEHQGLDPVAWVQKAHRAGWLVIGLRRRNILRQVLSNVAAQARGEYHNKTSSVEPVQLVVDVDDLLHWMRVRQELGEREELVLRDVDPVRFVYEDHLVDSALWQSTCDTVFDRLALPSVPVTSPLQRLNASPLTELIANYDEVADAVRRTPFADLLVD